MRGFTVILFLSPSSSKSSSIVGNEKSFLEPEHKKDLQVSDFSLTWTWQLNICIWSVFCCITCLFENCSWILGSHWKFYRANNELVFTRRSVSLTVPNDVFSFCNIGPHGICKRHLGICTNDFSGLYIKNAYYLTKFISNLLESKYIYPYLKIFSNRIIAAKLRIRVEKRGVNPFRSYLWTITMPDLKTKAIELSNIKEKAKAVTNFKTLNLIPTQWFTMTDEIIYTHYRSTAGEWMTNFTPGESSSVNSLGESRRSFDANYYYYIWLIFSHEWCCRFQKIDFWRCTTASSYLRDQKNVVNVEENTWILFQACFSTIQIPHEMDSCAIQII